MYIYTETGILAGRILYRDLANKCGKPKELSEDGKRMLFRKGDNDPEVFLVEVSLEKLSIYKKCNIVREVRECIEKMKDAPNYKEVLQFFEVFLDELKDLKNINISFCLNDFGDVLVRLKPKSEFLKKVLKNREDLALFAESDDEDE